MSKSNDPAVVVLAELIHGRLTSLRSELQEKVELAIQIAAGNLAHELAATAAQPPSDDSAR